MAVYTLSHGLSANPDIAVNKEERESGELPADREERAQEYHDSALFAKKVRPFRGSWPRSVLPKHILQFSHGKVQG